MQGDTPLARLVSTRREEILEHWTEHLRDVLGEELPEPLLVDNAPDLLDVLVASLRAGRAQSGGAQDVGARHGEERLRAGLDLDRLVHEYGSLRLFLLELADRDGVPVRGRDLVVLEDVMSTALAGSVRRFVETREALRRCHEQAARHASELLDLGDAFLELDAEFRIVRVNPNQERLSGQPRDQTLGRTFWEVWPETADPSTKYFREYHRCMRERVPVSFVEHFAPLDMWTDVTAYPTSTGGIAVFFRDTTAQKEMEDAVRASEERYRQLSDALADANVQLRESDRHKDEFLAMLSHELRNPLAPIRNGVYVLGRAPPGSELSQRAITIIGRQVEHLTRLVDDLLDVTRISRGKIALQMEHVELGGLLARTVEDHRGVFDENGVALDVHAPAEPLFVRADPTRLAQVIGNLLHNSAKFTPEGGHTRVSLERDRAGHACITVHDDGAGIAGESLDRLFEPFVQGDATLDRSAGGLGLGLSLVKRLVEKFGGTVEAASDGIGRGARFTVHLPVAEPAEHHVGT